jgi:hypothetical protein
VLSIEYIRKSNWHIMALDKALRHELEGRGFDSRRYFLHFHCVSPSG